MPYGPAVKYHRPNSVIVAQGGTFTRQTELKWAPLPTQAFWITKTNMAELWRKKIKDSFQRLQVKRKLDVGTVRENQAGGDGCWAFSLQAETERRAAREGKPKRLHTATDGALFLRSGLEKNPSH